MILIDCEHFNSATRQVTILTGPLIVRDSNLLPGLFYKNERLCAHTHREFRACSLSCLFRLMEDTYPKDDHVFSGVHVRKPLNDEAAEV